LKWASLTKYQLAFAYRRVFGQPLVAKNLLYEIMDADSCVHPAAGQESEYTLYNAHRELFEIIFAQFNGASTLDEKEALPDLIKELQERGLGGTFSPQFYAQYTTSIGRLYGKLGPFTSFTVLSMRSSKTVWLP
jgi:hypothetical protein